MHVSHLHHPEPLAQPPQPGRRRALAWLAAAGLPLGSPTARAQPVAQARWLYGFPAGSAGDTVARRLADKLAGSAYSRLPPLVDNKVGAGGRIALEALKTAPADGSVLALTPMSALTIYPHVYRRLAYDPVADLQPVAQVAVAHHGLAVGPLVPASVTDVKGFVAWARAHPAQASYGSPAAGSTPHFLGALLALEQGVALQHVPYRGSVPGITDLVGGQLAAMLTPAGDFLAHHRSGKLRLLATSGRHRLTFTPEVPTFAEQGLDALTAEEAFALYAPARSPAPVLAAAASAVLAALQDKAVVDGLATVGLLAQGAPADALARSQRAEFERWGPLVRRVGFSADS